MVKTLFIFLSAILAISGKKYRCDLNETIYLEKNEIVFFESYSYPFASSILSLQEFSCKMNFSLVSPNSTDKLIVAYNGIFLNNFMVTRFLVLDNDYSLIPDPNDLDKEVIAIQGYALHENIEDNCPFESISRENAFEISDETEIIKLRSTYFENDTRIRACKWKFNSTIQYGFKIVVEIFDNTTTANFTIKNSTDIFVVNALVIPYHPFYNQDNYIEISLSAGNQIQNNPLNEFQAYISIVKKQYEISDAICDISDKSVWSTDLTVGYKNNAKCSHQITLLPKHGIHVAVYIVSLEKNVDYIKYNIEGQTNATKIIEPQRDFVIESYDKNDSEKYVLFEFVSDGSVQFSGFEIAFHQYACQCAVSNIIPCTKDSIFITEFYIMDNISYYCGDLQCNFTFEKCPDTYLIVQIDSVDLYDVEDTFTFISNDETVLEIDKGNRIIYRFEIYFNPNNTNQLKVLTYPSRIYRTFYMFYQYFDKPPVKTMDIIFSNKNPSYFVSNGITYERLPEYTLIEMSEDVRFQNLSFIIYTNFQIGVTTLQDGLNIYNNESFSINLLKDNCFVGDNPYKCILNTNKFVVSFKSSEKGYFLDLAIRLSKPTNGCVFKENIFVAKGTSENVFLSALANSEGDCMIRLLIDNQNNFVITHLWTTAINDNVKIYIGNDTTRLLLQFNSKTMKDWKFIGLFSKTYLIFVPKNSAIFIKMKNNFDFNALKFFFNILQFPFNSIISSTHFGTLRQLFSPSLIVFIIKNYSVKFTVLYYNMLPLDDFHFIVNNNEISKNFKIGDSITFVKNQNVTMSYYRNSSIDGSNGIIFFIETLQL